MKKAYSEFRKLFILSSFVMMNKAYSFDERFIFMKEWIFLTFQQTISELQEKYKAYSHFIKKQQKLFCLLLNKAFSFAIRLIHLLSVDLICFIILLDQHVYQSNLCNIFIVFTLLAFYLFISHTSICFNF